MRHWNVYDRAMAISGLILLTLALMAIVAGCGGSFWHTVVMPASSYSYQCAGDALVAEGFDISRFHKSRQWLIAERDTDRRVPHTTLWSIQDRATVDVGADGRLAVGVVEVRRYVTRMGLVEELFPAPAEVVALADSIATGCGR